MTCCKVYLVLLSALIACHVDANCEKISSQLIDVSRAPWNDHHGAYESASSKVLPRYYDSHESAGDHFETSSGRLPIAGLKSKSKQQNEDKTAKKPIYTLTNENSFKRKEFVAAIAPNCREIKVKSIKPGESVTTCYKCKDPITKSTYERCTRDSYPKTSASASTNEQRFLRAPISFRYRRSNMEKEIGSGYGGYHDDKSWNPYRFTQEYFIDATHDVPAAYKSKGEVCDKVLKDSMVCMVCRDAKTNGKYEQCSYVNQPREKAYSYTKSSSFGKPEQQRKDESAEQKPEETPYSESANFEVSDRRRDRDPTDVEEVPRSTYDHPNASAEETREQNDRAPDDCKKVQRDLKTCVVCKDSKTGGTYEKCTFTYQPSEKLYKYSRSKTFGYPDKTSDLGPNHETAHGTSDKTTDYSQSPDSTRDYFDTSKVEVSAYPRRSEGPSEARVTSHDESDSAQLQERGNSSNYPEVSSKYHTEYHPSSSSDSESYLGGTTSSKSEDKNPEENADHCKKFQKDSMTCIVCKDPKTGNDFERCSYSYQPSDKLFSYSTSRSFGNSTPHRRDDETDESVRESYVPRRSLTSDKATSESTDHLTKEQQSRKEVDAGYLNTARKKAEIEEFMQNFGKKDRSKCKRVMRDKMTCYQCVDEDGFQKEECVFVTGQTPFSAGQVKDQLQIEPAASRVRRLGQREETVAPLDATASASENSYVKLEKPDNEYSEEAPQATEETKEAEPYDYTSETRPRYDKVLGFTLPAYMSTMSEHEAEFDEVVASSHDRR